MGWLPTLPPSRNRDLRLCPNSLTPLSSLRSNPRSPWVDHSLLSSTPLRDSTDKSEPSKLSTTLCGPSNKLTAPRRSPSEPRRSKTVTTLTPELRSITEPAPLLSPELRSISVSTKKTKSIPKPLSTNSPTSETPNTLLSSVSKRDTTTPSLFLVTPWTSLMSSLLVRPPSSNSPNTP